MEERLNLGRHRCTPCHQTCYRSARFDPELLDMYSMPPTAARLRTRARTQGVTARHSTFYWRLEKNADFEARMPVERNSLEAYTDWEQHRMGLGLPFPLHRKSANFAERRRDEKLCWWNNLEVEDFRGRKFGRICRKAPKILKIRIWQKKLAEMQKKGGEIWRNFVCQICFAKFYFSLPMKKSMEPEEVAKIKKLSGN